MSRSAKTLSAALALGLAALGLTTRSSLAEPAAEVFSLGRSSASGAVCQAVRDYEDPLAQGRGAKAWRVRCRGYSTALGHLYLLPKDQEPAWRQALTGRAACQPAEAAALGGVSGATRAACKLGAAGTPYLAYAAAGGREALAAEGFAPLADILETGLRVVGGAAQPPQATAAQMSAAQAEIAADFPGSGGLAAAEEQAANDPERLRGRGYTQNNEWQFGDAETAFRALAAAADQAQPKDRAEALLNLALNVSNNGRFAEAEALFAEADAQAAQTGDLLLRARSLNYRAMHARNQRRFEAAVPLARQALEVRQSARNAGLVRETGGVVVADASGVIIDGALAGKLNARGGGQTLIDPSRVTLSDQLAIQDAQAWQIIGSSMAASGDAPGARAALGEARNILVARETVGRVTAWLHARVEADLAGLDMTAGQPGQAASGYGRALEILRTRHAGSAAEGALLLDLGAAQAAGGQRDQALASFGQSMAIFHEQRGGLGGSRDAAKPYFDLLLDVSAREPAKAGDYAARFFDASEAAVTSATARTINRLAARVASGDGATAGLARGLDDARREVQIVESQVAAAQARGEYEGALRETTDARLKSLQAEADALEGELLTANPRYAQLVSAGAPAGELQKALRPGEAYLKLLVLEGGSYGVLITSATVKPYAIPLNREQIERVVAGLRTSVEPGDTLPAFNVAASAALFDVLVGPVKADLMAASHLVYEPDGALISLPVATFVTDRASVEMMASRSQPGAAPDYRGVAWLGAKMDSSLVVSGASFLQSRRFAPSRAQRAYLGFGDPDLPRSDPRAYGELVTMGGRRSATLEQVCGATRSALLNIPALPETAGEVRAVAQALGAPDGVVLGGAFSDTALAERTDLNNYRILYFATHGLLPQPEGCLPEPALVTSLGGEGSDALLDASEILDLKLDADLVVLAACDTGGAGSESAERTGLAGGGEALGGLARAMIYAGSRGLVISHWSVDSESAVRVLTAAFASRAPSQAEGLKAAQAELQADPLLSHPYFWAPFTVVGDGARPLPGA